MRSTETPWPPYHILEESLEASAQRRLDRLERLYHMGQDNIWDGRRALADLLDAHGPPRPAPQHEAALRKIVSILLWGELAAWSISADLAERIDDIEAKMAATSQAHDEARHFYVLRDYCRALGGEIPRLGGVGRRFLLGILATDSLAEKLVGMQLLVESNALALFRALVEANIEPVLTGLLPYYERDEARHVGLGVMYLPHLLSRLSAAESARLIAFQLRCVAYLMTGGMLLREEMEALGIDQRKVTRYVVKLQQECFDKMRNIPPVWGRKRRRNVRGVLNPASGLGPVILDFMHPVGGPKNATPLHSAALCAWTGAGRVLDRVLA